MATNLKWAFPDIPFRATNHAFPSKSYSGTTYDAENVVAGSRSSRFQFDASYATPAHVFDLGANYTSVDNTADYFIVADANLSIAESSNSIRLAARTGTSGLYTSIFSNAWAASDLKGPNNRDYITTFTETASYRQWHVQLHSGASVDTFPHSKVYFGKFFDFGRDPTLQSTMEVGYERDQKIYHAISLNLKYDGLSADTRESFEEKIGQYRDENPVFLYSETYDPILMGQELLNVVIDDYAFTQRNAFQFDLRIRVREVF